MSNDQAIHNLIVNNDPGIFINMVNNLLNQTIDEQILQAGINQSLTETINTKKDNISLDIVPIKYSTLQNKPHNEKCMICMQIFNDDDDITNECHRFHFKCLEEWVKYKPECPTCRNQININIEDSIEMNISLLQCEECGENYEEEDSHECEEDALEVSGDALEVSEHLDEIEDSDEEL